VATAAAITEYETAMRLDPSFTRPLARMAFAYALFVAWEWPHPRLAWDGLLRRITRRARRACARFRVARRMDGRWNVRAVPESHVVGPLAGGSRPDARAAMLAAGDREGALRVLERAVPWGIMLWWYLRWPDFDPLRSDPRFKEIVVGSPFR
jgi:hypothetical protein